MSLRTKLILVLVGCTTVASLLVGTLSYRATQSRLLAEIDDSLTLALRTAIPREAGFRGVSPGRPLRTPGFVESQLLDSNGEIVASGGDPLPVSREDVEVASDPDGSTGGDPLDMGAALVRTDESGDETLRVITAPLDGPLGAIQVARSLAETERVLAALRGQVLGLTLVVAAIAAAVGWFVSVRITSRLERVTNAAEDVARTGDLGVKVPVEGSDESARLGTAFNRMLDALANSRADQQRLVVDAGHELRTPMTSLRTNLYALRSIDSLSESQRSRVLSDIESESAEMSRLVEEVMEVATESLRNEPEVSLDLSELVSSVVQRFQGRTDRQLILSAEPSWVIGWADSLRRAVSNLIDNALKFDQSGTPVEVSVRQGTVSVADRGPGFHDGDLSNGDLSKVFERFYRTDAARSESGSGLGLSIVQRIVEEHGGSVFAENREGSGAVVGFTLPVLPEN